MISVEKALQLIKNNSFPLHGETIELSKALNRTLEKDVQSPIDMPPFQQSAMDGYALCLHNSNTYQLIDEVKAGDSHTPLLKKGEAVRIFTGAAVPKTANAVIMQEKVIAKEGYLVLNSSVLERDNIRPQGEQVKKDETALKKGQKLTPAAIGFLASLGITKVSVYKKPQITVVVTGNELITPGQVLQHGKIYESNSIMLGAALQNTGHQNVAIQHVTDDYFQTKELLNNCINNNDLVIITGGISVGDYDFVGKALSELQVQEVFYKVKQKPGKPLYYGKKKSTTVFALPGNPAAALSCFYSYVYLSLQIMDGSQLQQLSKSSAISTTVFEKKGNRAQFLKAIVADDKATILEGQSSAMLQTFSLANALVYMPEELNKIELNDTVNVIHLPN